MRVWLWLMVTTFAGGCAGQKGQAVPGSAPQQVTLERSLITPQGGGSLSELFEEAQRLYEAGEYGKAAALLDRLYRVEPRGKLAAETLHLAGEAWEKAGDRRASLGRFEAVAREFPEHELGRDGWLRSIRLLAFLEKWKLAGKLSEGFLKRYDDLRAIEHVVALSGVALGKLAAGDIEQASFNVEKGRNIIEAHRLDAAGAIPRDLAQLYYALGEVRRLRAERILFRPMPKNFAAVLEQRCQLLLDAQSAYSDTMRAYDAHWSAMAGYRVGELYKRLHVDLMDVPLPKGATDESKRQLFEGALRLRYSVLLDKALSMMDHTLAMARRTGERSRWVLKTEEAQAEIKKAQAAENAAIDRLPYSRAELRKALDELAKKKAPSAVGSS